MLRNIFVLFLALASTASALYGPKSDVVMVGANNFKEEVKNFKGVVFVEFFAPWCGHCKNLTPEYEKAASILKGVVKVVAVDATQHESLAQKYQISGYPSIRVFGADKSRAPAEFNGRTSDEIVSEAMRVTNQMVKERKSGKSSKGSSKKSTGGGGEKPKAKKAKGGSKSDVVELTELNFNAMVMESDEMWMVEFFAPWCGHCKNLAPEWEKAATELKAQGVKLGAIDATVEKGLAEKYGIKGFPTIKVFGAGAKGKAKDYNGARDADGIVAFALQAMESSGAPVAMHQLVDNTIFTESCVNSKLCAVLFVPHILDSGAEGRNKYLTTFAEVAQDFRKMPFAFAWSEANAQPDLEHLLSINGNYPTLAVLSAEKKVFAVPKASWNAKNIKAFMQGVLSGT